MSDCFYTFAMRHNLGLAVSERRRGTFCDERAGECVEVWYQLWGLGDIALASPVTNPCKIGIIYVPENGDSRWQEKETEMP